MNHMNELIAAAQQALEFIDANADGADERDIAATLRTAIEAAEKQEPFGYFQYSMSMDAWVQNRDSNKGVAFYTTPPAAPVHEPVITDDLPKGFIPLQRRNGQLVYAACMDFNARHYKWLMRKHPNGHWVSERKLEDWEVMQVEDQDHYGIIQEAEATPPAGEKK